MTIKADELIKMIKYCAANVNPVEISSQIQDDNLGQFCITIRNEIHRLLRQLEKEIDK